MAKRHARTGTRTGAHRHERAHGTAASGREPRRERKTSAPAASFRQPSSDVAVLFGYHSVREALRVGRRKALTLFATANAASKLAAEIEDAGVEVRIVDMSILDARLGRDAVHQGLMLEARPLPSLDVADVAQSGGVLLVLDGVTDPHNVGAILRVAAAYDVRGLVMTDRHSPPLDGVLAKAASGGLEHIPVARIVNLARALDQLGEMGFQRVGLDSDADVSFEGVCEAGPKALVLGAEGSGLRRLTRERCDILAKLTFPGAIRSLNVSTACAVALATLKLIDRTVDT